MSYDTDVVADGPLGYWKLDETSGTSMADSSGNTRNGVYSGVAALNQPPLLPYGSSGAALGSSSSEGIGSVFTGTWMNVTSLTAEAWVKPASSDGNYRGYISRYQFNPGGWILFQQGGKFALDIVASGDQLLYAPSSYTVGTVYHLVGTYDGTTMRLYVNGSEVANRALSGGLGGTMGQSLRIGGYNGGDYCACVLDNAAIYGTALSAARISAHYATAQSYVLNLAQVGQVWPT